MPVTILNAKEKKCILQDIEEQWGAHMQHDYAFLKHSDGRIFIVNSDAGRIDFEKIRADSIGLYFGEYEGNSELRLSIEGSQIIGAKATRNVIELAPEEARKWLKGVEIGIEEQHDGFSIIKSGEDFLGCGKTKNNHIINFVPKTRRINSVD